MTSFVEFSMAMQNFLMLLMEICLVLESVLLFSRIIYSSGKKKIITAAVIYAISFLLMSALLNDHRCSIGNEEYAPILNLVPGWLLTAGIVGLSFYLGWSIWREHCRYKEFLSPWSVKEAMDDVPCGVCFSDPLGRIILCNVKMRELNRKLTGSYLQDYNILRQAIDTVTDTGEIRRLSKDNNVFYFPDGSVWLFQEYQMQEPALLGYIQTVAINVSEIYYNNEQIRANNEKMELLNQKLEEMYEKIGDKIREQETLAMKMQVHDNFGRSLLAIRRMLEKKEEPENMEEQLAVLKQLVYILTSTTVESKEKLYEDTVRQAEELGISVQVTGVFPSYPPYRFLADRAIRECVTNCARHAQGRNVFVEMKENSDGYVVRITNDGESPRKNAREGGGLSALRKAAQSEKCRMVTKFEPEFSLILEMPVAERI